MLKLYIVMRHIVIFSHYGAKPRTRVLHYLWYSLAPHWCLDPMLWTSSIKCSFCCADLKVSVMVSATETELVLYFLSRFKSIGVEFASVQIHHLHTCQHYFSELCLKTSWFLLQCGTLYKNCYFTVMSEYCRFLLYGVKCVHFCCLISF